MKKTQYFNNIALSLDTKTLARLCHYCSPINGGRTAGDDTGKGKPGIIETGGAN